MAANGVPASATTTAELDWLAEEPSSPQEPFDVVLACDVFFQDGCMPPLTQLLSRLTSPGGTLLTAMPVESEYRVQATQAEARRVLPPSSRAVASSP